MASIYCPDCNRQAGDNWTECYFCGGKNLREGKLSSVPSYCPDCNKQVVFNHWTKCYFCGGKNLRLGKPSSSFEFNIMEIKKFLIEFFRPRKLDKDGKELDHRTHWTLFFVVVFIVFVVLPIVNKFV